MQQRVNSYQISLRGPEDDSFGAPKLDDHYHNQAKSLNNADGKPGSRRYYKKERTSKSLNLALILISISFSNYMNHDESNRLLTIPLYGQIGCIIPFFAYSISSLHKSSIEWQIIPFYGELIAN